MPASIAPAVPAIGIDCNELAFLPAPCESKDDDAIAFLQGPPAPTKFAKSGSLLTLSLAVAGSMLSSGATTPGEASSEVDDQSDYEFRADGQEEYYQFLQEMGCDFPQVQDEDSDDSELDANELEDDLQVEYTADDREEYYKEEEEEVEDWDGTEEWFEEGMSKSRGAPPNDIVDKNQMSADTNGGVENQLPYDDDFVVGPKRPFRPRVSISLGPSIYLQRALLSVAAQRNGEFAAPCVATSATQ